jgi:hypothetical protein
MKAKMKYIGILGCMLGTIFQLHSQGYIVPNGVIVYTGYTGPGTEIDVLYNPTDVPPTTGDYTGFFLIPQSPNTFSYDVIVNVGVRVFLVSSLDPITQSTVLSGNYTELTYPNSYVFDDGVPFYVGLYTGNVQSAPPDGIYDDPLFGWAELENVGGAIQLLDSALEYKGGGIYAGTQNIIQIPEPGILALVALGGLFFGLRRCWMAK